MASAIRQMTGVGGDIRKIARLLQKKAPPGHMLAYINQEEADLLKARGGSGKPHEDTGVPSFQTDDDILFSDVGLAPAPPTPPQEQGPSTELKSSSVAPLDVSAPAQPVNMNAVRDTANPLFPEYQQYLRNQGGASDADVASVGDRFYTPSELGFQPGGSYAPTVDAITGAASTIPTPREQGFYAGGSEAPTKIDKDLLGQASDWFKGLSKETKERLGIGGIQAVIGAYQSQQAAEQGRQAKEEMQRMAQPYQQQGKELIAKAQKGELSPVGQQQLQAVQAQAAQGAQARGGVGAQQAQAQVEAYRQQLLQGQYDYGLKVAGIGDQIMTGAIKTGMQADQYVNQLTNNYYNNIARAMYGQAPQVSGQQPASTSASA